MAKKLIISAAMLIAIGLLVFGAGPVHAQATRTWVSGIGNDADPCRRTAPCKTFAGAISKTAINGEIDCLDPGGFGALTITKSITIDCSATLGSILASGTNAININVAVSANDPTRTVVLRGVTLNGTGSSGTVGTRTGLVGINITQAAAVSVEQTVINDFVTAGVLVNATAGVNLLLSDVAIRNITNQGVRLTTTAGQVVAQLDNVRVYTTLTGVETTNRGRVGLRNSFFSHNTSGVITNGSDNQINAQNIFVTFGSVGLRANAGSTIRVGDSFIVQNATGLNANGGSLISLSNNSVSGNTTPGVFTSTEVKL